MHSVLQTTIKTFKGKLLYLQKKRMNFIGIASTEKVPEVRAIRALDWINFSNQASQANSINSLGYQ